jgi:DNA-binding NtrC family response regulator
VTTGTSPHSEMRDTHGLVGRSPAAQELLSRVERFAPHADIVLIHGEPGSGRSTVAWLMHQLGAHSGGQFREIQCSPAMAPETVAGLFSGLERADASDAGSLVLDEVTELAKPAQAALLGALVALEKRNDAQRPPIAIYSTSGRTWGVGVEGEAFRLGLWYRLNAIELTVPALRDRRDDIPDLANRFASDHAERLGVAAPQFSGRALEILTCQPWPGNLRELRNVIGRCCLLSDGPVIGERPVSTALVCQATPPTLAASRVDSAGARAVADRLDVVQRAHVLDVLSRERGNKARAARHLGVSRRALYRLLDRMPA